MLLRLNAILNLSILLGIEMNRNKGEAFTLSSSWMTVRNWECMCQCASRYKTKRYCYVKKHAADLAQDKTSKGRIKGFMFRSASLDQMLSLKG